MSTLWSEGRFPMILVVSALSPSPERNNRSIALQAAMPALYVIFAVQELIVAHQGVLLSSKEVVSDSERADCIARLSRPYIGP